MKKKETTALALLAEALRARGEKGGRAPSDYRVPGLWTSLDRGGSEISVNPYSYYLEVIDRIRKSRVVPRKDSSKGGEWTKDAVIYNMFVRTTTAYDHNGNGSLDIPVNKDGFRETGTFLKAIAMLPYMQRLGANTVHLLPITSIGHDGNKGSLGSPYAIRNPYELDENLSEPALDLDAKTEFKAFVEAAHRLGLRVVVEFVFRTAAKDADWVKEHPDWFYWIREEIPVRHAGSTDPNQYGSPLFETEELEQIHKNVDSGRLDHLLPPHEIYRGFFTRAPSSARITREDGRFVGHLPDGSRVKIPGAFADWPPDDNQPPWGDVTYLKMYKHADFNYIAYNTIRMYDGRLARAKNKNGPLWERILGIIPYYQSEFQIDGVMIDMGHALPISLKSEMVRIARENDPDFAFWDENFSVTERSREEGYNAVVGYCWIDQRYPDRMRALCKYHAEKGFPIPYFATPETHNTPRAVERPGGTVYARWAMVVNAFLPAVPYLHSGYELAERMPINTGLDFTNEELAGLPSETLPLFSSHSYDWRSQDSFAEWVGHVLGIRKRYARLIADPDPASFRMLEEPNPHILAFARSTDSPLTRLAVVCNTNFEGDEFMRVQLQTEKDYCVDLLSERRIPRVGDHVEMNLGPGQCLVIEY
ncbi:MAG: alpha-glucosidase C-terminal domain-containing protein [Bacteroidota bacterium]